MKYFQFLFLVCCFIVVAACSEDINEPLVGGFGAPEQVRNVRVENLPGAAKLYYSLPYDRGLSYVQAEYTNTIGERVSVNSSAFKNYIMLEGFGEEKEYEIDLYSVSKSDEKSSPLKVTIHPTRPPVQLSASTLDVYATFGGVVLNYHNPFETEFVAYTLIKNEEGEWEEYDRIYSGAEFNKHAVRGLEPASVDFAFYLRDKWRNHSDTIYQSLTPLYEEELNKELWKDAALIDDFNERLYANNGVDYLWTPGDRTYFFQDHRDTPEKAVMPNWITIDFGRPYILGRMKSHMVQHADSWMFGSCSPRLFEVWGSNEATTDWSKWTLLGDFESNKPSGLPVGSLNNDDRQQIAEGEDFEFELTENSYRYIRYKVKETWGRSNYFCLLELSFWGQAVN